MISQALSRPRRGAFAVAAVTLIAGVVGGGQTAGAQSASAVSTQHVVFSHTGAQTASSYFEPVATQPRDYTSPPLAQGRAYVRIQVTSKPSRKPMQPQVCFWRHAANKFQFETCASTSGFTFTERGTYWLDLGSPASWWKLNGVYDWSQPASVVRIMLKDPATGSLFLSSKCGAACYRGADLADHVPVQMTAELVMVARGATLVPLDQWRLTCPTGWSPECGTGGNDGGGGNGPDITVTAAAGSFTARWPAVAGAKRYQLRYRPVGGEMVTLPAFTERSRTIDGLKRGTAYDVWVRAFVNGQWSDWSRKRVTV